MIVIYMAVYVAGLGLDVWSTWFCMHAFGDTGLSDEFNPLVRGTSLGRLIGHAGALAAAVIGAFCWGWLRRRGLYPEAGRSFRGFWDHVLGLASGRTDPSSTARRRWGNMLILVCVLGPMVLAMGHYRVALTNTLQGLRWITWGSVGIFIAVRVLEVVAYSLLGACAMFWDYREDHHGGK